MPSRPFEWASTEGRQLLMSLDAEKSATKPDSAPSQKDGRSKRRKQLITLLLASIALVLVLVVLVGRLRSPPTRGTVRDNVKDGLRYVWIPAGGFQQGCSKFDADCIADEKPAHEVAFFTGYWMGQTEVTVEAYLRFAAATNRKMPPEVAFGERQLNLDWKDLKAPIANVDWHEAKAFCEWAGGGLPTEARWEYAARAGNAASRHGECNSCRDSRHVQATRAAPPHRWTQ